MNRNHGWDGTKTYLCWAQMKNRCLNPRNKNYSQYGRRGITICDRWLDFRNFLEDMGEKPAGLTLDRIDNNGNYEAENCRWTTYQQQNLNRSVVAKNYFWHKKDKVYSIQLTRNRKKYRFGTAKTKKEAEQKATVARIAMDIFPRLESILE